MVEFPLVLAWPLLAFDPQSPTETTEHLLDEVESQRRLRCCQCQHWVTTESWRISVQGSHDHRFFNPHGVIYHIGCFQEAVGARALPVASDEFSWFPGFHWQIAVCSSCQAHLGWLFGKKLTVPFWGLILNRLTN